jgi:hypothetical protein
MRRRRAFRSDIGGCNSLALDDKNHILFAAYAVSGNRPVPPPKPTMVILSAVDGNPARAAARRRLRRRRVRSVDHDVQLAAAVAIVKEKVPPASRSAEPQHMAGAHAHLRQQDNHVLT